MSRLSLGRSLLTLNVLCLWAFFAFVLVWFRNQPLSSTVSFRSKVFICRISVGISVEHSTVNLPFLAALLLESLRGWRSDFAFCEGRVSCALHFGLWPAVNALVRRLDRKGLWLFLDCHEACPLTLNSFLLLFLLLGLRWFCNISIWAVISVRSWRGQQAPKSIMHPLLYDWGSALYRKRRFIMLFHFGVLYLGAHSLDIFWRRPLLLFCWDHYLLL